MCKISTSGATYLRTVSCSMAHLRCGGDALSLAVPCFHSRGRRRRMALTGKQPTDDIAIPAYTASRSKGDGTRRACRPSQIHHTPYNSPRTPIHVSTGLFIRSAPTASSFLNSTATLRTAGDDTARRDSSNLKSSTSRPDALRSAIANAEPQSSSETARATVVVLLPMAGRPAPWLYPNLH